MLERQFHQDSVRILALPLSMCLTFGYFVFGMRKIFCRMQAVLVLKARGAHIKVKASASRI